MCHVDVVGLGNSKKQTLAKCNTVDQHLLHFARRLITRIVQFDVSTLHRIDKSEILGNYILLAI